MFFLTLNKKQINACFFLIFVTLQLAMSCSTEEPSNAKFSISISEVTDFSVTAIITHTGTNRDNYYVFAVKGEDIDVADEITKHNASIQSLTSVSPYDQKKRIVTLNGLSPESKYTCIIYEVNESGNPTGKFASAIFKTSEEKISFEKNPSWLVCYEGQGTYNNKTYSKVIVYVQETVEERYFICIYDKAIVDQYSETKDFIRFAYNNFIKEHNDLGDEYFWMQDNFVRIESTEYYKYLYKGEYQAFAIGIDYTGALTGHYAASEVFEFDRYELDPEYEYLLGDWIITDDIGGEIYVYISEKWANSSYTMSGWGYNDCPFSLYVSLNSVEYTLNLNRQSVWGRTWGDDKDKLLSLEPWYLDENDNFRILSYDNYLATAKMNDDGSLTFKPGFSKTLSNQEKAKTLGVVVTYTDSDGKKTYYKSSKMQLPFTMKKL